VIQEAWKPTETVLTGFINHIAQLRDSERGGGTLINITNPCLRFSKVLSINQDMNGYKILLKDNYFVWVVPIYLPKSSRRLVQTVFDWMWKNLSPRDIEYTILVGDWNIDTTSQEDAKAEFLRALCKQSQMRLIIPSTPTRQDKYLDFCVLGNAIKGTVKEVKKSLSDHKSIIIEISVPLPTKKHFLLLPNRKMANELTLKCLEDSSDSEEFLRRFHQGYQKDKALVKIYQKKYKSDLLEKLLDLDELKEVRREIREYSKSQLCVNEIQRFRESKEKLFYFSREFTNITNTRRETAALSKL